MNRTAKLSTATLLVAFGFWSLHAVGGSNAPTTLPARPYHLFMQSVSGAEPAEWVFVIVSPDGYPSVTTFSKLQRTIEIVVKSPATLNWEPSDLRSDGEPEPLDIPANKDALIHFCKEHNITFVTIPAG